MTATDATSPANNEIWYTSTNDQPISPTVIDAFDASIVSNTYSDGKGKIIFDKDITMIGDYAFKGSSKLKSIIIPNRVTTIGSWAFDDSSNLVCVTIGANVTTIKRYAFSGAENLMTIYCKPLVPPAINYYAREYHNPELSFERNEGMKIFVPSQSYDTYKSAYSPGSMEQTLSPGNWWLYRSYMEPYEFYKFD